MPAIQKPFTSETKARGSIGPADWTKVSLVPFPADRIADLWRWLLQYPAANFDDQGPETLEQFEAAFAVMARGSRQLWGAEIDGELLGAIGLEQLSPRTGLLRGICFDQSAHGSGAPLAAVQKLLDVAWASGYRKVSARYLASNRRAHAFFKKLGARQEGYLVEDTEQAGQPIDVRIVALWPPKGEGR
jgi:RimJ/RimL family protein N-acetyltransferase